MSRICSHALYSPIAHHNRSATEEEEQRKLALVAEYRKQYEVGLDDSSSSGFELDEMAFANNKKTTITTPPAKLSQRFSISNIASEEQTRKSLEALKNKGSDEDDDDDDDDDMLDHLVVSKLMGILERDNEKTVSDQDLLPFFHHWDQVRDAFHSHMDATLPNSLLAYLETKSRPEDLTRLLLCGNWIPTFFPSECPEDVAKWLYGFSRFSNLVNSPLILIGFAQIWIHLLVR
jgi:hypothetical protein